MSAIFTRGVSKTNLKCLNNLHHTCRPRLFCIYFVPVIRTACCDSNGGAISTISVTYSCTSFCAMADLREVLPSFDLQPWRHLTFSLEKKNVYTAELITQDSVEIARKCPLPPREVKRFATAVIAALQQDVLGTVLISQTSPQKEDEQPPRKKLRFDQAESGKKEVRFVKTLDANIDHCLGGGFPTGNVCEIVGER